MRRSASVVVSVLSAAVVVVASNCGGMDPGTAGGGSASGGGSAGGGTATAGGGAAGGGSVGGGSAGGGTSTAGGGSAGGGAAGGGSAGGGSAGGGSAGGGSAGGGSAGGGSGGGGGAAGGGSAGGGSATLPNFSFFVTSLEAMRSLSNSDAGFGSNLTFGETGVGAGLRGADKICTTIAERSMPGSGVKQWRAFLSASVSADGGASPENAIDRIGKGPWFDRSGKLVAPDSGYLLIKNRPNSVVFNDLPNETGIGNHGTVDNHDTLTGSSATGRYTSMNINCQNWTSSAGNIGQPQIGHSWPRTATSGRDWIADHGAPGCAPGVNLINNGPGTPGNNTVGGGGGYGGIYCFALSP